MGWERVSHPSTLRMVIGPEASSPSRECLNARSRGLGPWPTIVIGGVIQKRMIYEA
jgi:hypothetical protein